LGHQPMNPSGPFGSPDGPYTRQAQLTLQPSSFTTNYYLVQTSDRLTLTCVNHKSW
ncbi:hypothetical protein TorRG33x02_335100, partial [Trema orientale]